MNNCLKKKNKNRQKKNLDRLKYNNKFKRLIIRLLLLKKKEILWTKKKIKRYICIMSKRLKGNKNYKKKLNDSKMLKKKRFKN